MTSPLLFDLDGTLIDSLADIAASANHLRVSYGLQPVASEAARSWVGDGVFALMERCLAELGPLDPIRDEAWNRYSEHHFEQCTRLVRPYPGVSACLAQWQAVGHPMAVVTNKPTRFVTRILDHLQLTDFFPAVVCGDTLPVKKPDPEPVREALRRLGNPPGTATMVGDSVQDLRAGKAAGVRTAAALFGFSDEEALRREGADEYWPAFGQPA